MAETASKVPVKNEQNVPRNMTAMEAWRPVESLRREIDRLFEDLGRDFWRFPFRNSAFNVGPSWQRELAWAAAPAVDIVDKENAYEVTAELPGMDEKNIEVRLANGDLTIRGEKRDEKEEKRKGYHLQERHFGSFERTFAVPEGVDVEKIDASFKNGVLTVKLPKKPEAIKPAKKIEVKAAA